MERFCRILVPSSRFCVFGRHKALLLCKSPCEGAASVGGESRRTAAPPSEEKFPEEICSSPVQDSKIAARHKNRCKQIKIHRSHKPERECPLNRKHSLILFALLIENSRDSKRAAALLSHARQRSPKKQLLRGGSTPRFFAQLRSVGSKTTWQAPARKRICAYRLNAAEYKMQRRLLSDE